MIRLISVITCSASTANLNCCRGSVESLILWDVKWNELINRKEMNCMHRVYERKMFVAKIKAWQNIARISVVPGIFLHKYLSQTRITIKRQL